MSNILHRPINPGAFLKSPCTLPHLVRVLNVMTGSPKTSSQPDLILGQQQMYVSLPTQLNYK